MTYLNSKSFCITCCVKTECVRLLLTAVITDVAQSSASLQQHLLIGGVEQLD